MTERPAHGSVPPSGRVVAVDLGERRIGLAVSDAARTMAFPRAYLERRADPGWHRRQLVELVEEEGATVVVVGLPLSLDGRKGPAARSAEAEVAALCPLLEAVGVPVVTFDERFTTVRAGAALAGAGKRGSAARHSVDSAAATVLLQDWLEYQRPVGSR